MEFNLVEVSPEKLFDCPVEARFQSQRHRPQVVKKRITNILLLDDHD